MSFKKYTYLWKISGDIFKPKFGISRFRFKFMVKAFIFSEHIKPLLDAKENSAIKKLISQRPEILGVIIWPYLCSKWDARTRLNKIVEHYTAIEDLTFKIDFPLDGALKLLDLAEVHENLHIVLDQPIWFMREGQLVINLFLGNVRILSLAFSLARESGKVVAYVGALQGRNLDWLLDANREITKSLYGMRPRDFLFELFRDFCRIVGVSKIYAVSESSRHHRSGYFATKTKSEELKLNYDEIWIERGGILENLDFYVFSVNVQKKNLEEVSSKKRSMYRRRYDLLKNIEARMLEVCSHLDDDRLLEYPFSSL